MLRIVALLALSLGLAAPVPCTPREVAITVDDLPWVEFGRSRDADVARRHVKLVRALHGTDAIGFVNEDKLERDGRRDPVRVAMLRDWIDAGLELGNHTYGHVGLHQTPIEDYERAIVRGERVTRELLARSGREPRWFRHPYLHAGRDDAVRARLAAFLHDHGYRVAPVTIDSGEWIYARAYVVALDRGERALARRLRADYRAYMLAKIAFFERAAQGLFGREIRHVLLLHANALNADALPTLLRDIGRRGYRFVSLERALADPAYAHDDGYRGSAGISWLHRWAMAEGKPKSFYAGEPEVPKWVLDLAGVEGE